MSSCIIYTTAAARINVRNSTRKITPNKGRNATFKFYIYCTKTLISNVKTKDTENMLKPQKYDPNQDQHLQQCTNY